MTGCESSLSNKFCVCTCVSGSKNCLGNLILLKNKTCCGCLPSRDFLTPEEKKVACKAWSNQLPERTRFLQPRKHRRDGTRGQPSQWQRRARKGQLTSLLIHLVAAPWSCHKERGLDTWTGLQGSYQGLPSINDQLLFLAGLRRAGMCSNSCQYCWAAIYCTFDKRRFFSGNLGFVNLC